MVPLLLLQVAAPVLSALKPVTPVFTLAAEATVTGRIDNDDQCLTVGERVAL